MRASRTVVLFMAAAAAVFAQNSGAISGVVFDNLGGLLPAAEIQAKNAASGTIYRATSSAKGEYTIAQMPPGSYEFAVVVHGGRLFVQNTVVEAGKTLRIEARLKDTNLGTLGDDVFAADAADRRPVPTGPAPRTLDGKPDFSGVWSPSRAIETGTSEMLPWAEAELKREGRAIENPTEIR
jgi:hypothetical protein